MHERQCVLLFLRNIESNCNDKTKNDVRCIVYNSQTQKCTGNKHHNANECESYAPRSEQYCVASGFTSCNEETDSNKNDERSEHPVDID